MSDGTLIRIEAGTEIVGALNAFVASRGLSNGWVRATGTLTRARIRVGKRERKTSAGNCTLVHLDAAVARERDGSRVRATATVVDANGAVIAGELLEAHAYDVEAFISVADSDVVRQSAADVGAGAVVRRRTAKKEKPTPEPSGGGWAAVAAMSEEVAGGAPKASAPQGKPDNAQRVSANVAAAREKMAAYARMTTEYADASELNRNDVIIHPKIGECRVVRVSGNDAIQVRVKGGPTRKLTMKIFNLVRTGDGRYELERK